MRTSAISLFTKLQQWDCLIPATLALTFASTSGCDSSNATAHRSDEVDASCAMKRKSKRYPPISASMENDDDVSPEMDCGRRSDTESWSTQAWGSSLSSYWKRWITESYGRRSEPNPLILFLFLSFLVFYNFRTQPSYFCYFRAALLMLLSESLPKWPYHLKEYMALELG